MQLERLSCVLSMDKVPMYHRRRLCPLLPYTQPDCQNEMFAVNVSANKRCVHIDKARTKRRIYWYLYNTATGQTYLLLHFSVMKSYSCRYHEATPGMMISFFDRIRITASPGSLMNVSLDDTH